MYSISLRSWSMVLIFFVAFVGFSCTVYWWAKGPTIRADEVRGYRLLASGTPAPRTLFRLQGEAAQKAADNFAFTSGGPVYECLDERGWFRVVFRGNEQASQSFNVYLPNGQMNVAGASGEPLHLRESSRIYWEKLIQAHRFR